MRRIRFPPCRKRRAFGWQPIRGLNPSGSRMIALDPIAAEKGLLLTGEMPGAHPHLQRPVEYADLS